MKKNYLKTFIATLLMAVGSINAQAEGLSLTQNGTSTYLLPANASTADGVSSFSDNPFTGGTVKKGTNVTAFTVNSSTDAGVAAFDTPYALTDGEEVTISFIAYQGWIGKDRNSTIAITNSESKEIFSYAYKPDNSCSVFSVKIGGTEVLDAAFTGQSKADGGKGANAFTHNSQAYSTKQDNNTVVTVTIKKTGNVSVNFKNVKNSIDKTFTGSLDENVTVDISKISFTSNIEELQATGITDLCLSSTVKTATLTTYTVKYTDQFGKEIKDATTHETYVGEIYTAPNSTLQTFLNGNETEKYIYNSGNEEKTAVEAAEENIITLVFDKYDRQLYSVYYKTDNEILDIITYSGGFFDGSTVKYYNKYSNFKGKWYMTESPYSITITSIKNEIIYTEADIDYFYEAEDLGYANKDIATGDNYSNGKKAAVAGGKMATLGTFPAGKYVVTAYLTNNGNRSIILRDTENADAATNTKAIIPVDKNSTSGEYSVAMTLTVPTTIGISGYTSGTTYNQSAGIDYIYIKKTAETVSLPYEYNTYCTQSALDFTGNEDVEAYTAEMNGEGTAVTLTQVYQVPEGAGVILKRKGEATTANVNIITSADELSGNQLKGVKTAMQAAELVAENAYILVDQLFCRVTESSEGELAAGKAYLAVPANVKAAATLSLGFGNITGATEVEAQAKATAGEIYNMQGMRVKSATKGIYIIGGKKYCF
ncbi:MAG: hypothetical protein J6B33_00140 [Prevotella sp.]|nr:hypothetical protein [Prevotella sp.]